VTNFSLLHSPVVGPTTWKWVAEELRGMGHEVKILVIGPQSTFGGWQEVVAEVVAQVTGADDTVFVAHSGAGPLLPTIVERSKCQGSSMVFIDAGLPTITTDTPLMPRALLDELSALAKNGVLPPWSEWFGPDVMASLIPDPNKRELIVLELPRIPLNYFFGTVPPVSKWPTDRNGYVLFSDAYLNDAQEARRRGWPVIELSGGHLDLVTRPRDVAVALVQASDAM
jgi:hypothetical protein